MADLLEHFAIGAAAALASAFVLPGSAQSAVIQLPGAVTRTGTVSGGNVQSCGSDFLGNCTRPGASSDTDINTMIGSDPFKIDLDAAATAFGPVASVQGETVGSKQFVENAIGAAGAQVQYQLEVTPVGVGLVLKVFQVPVTLIANVEASASGEDASAQASVEAFQLHGGIIDTVCPAGAPPSSCTNFKSPTNRISGNAAPNSVIDVIVSAVGGSIGNGQFQASADPILSIDDGLIPGTQINFRDAFTVIASSGVTQSVSPADRAVSEPGTLPVLVFGAMGAFGIGALKHGRWLPRAGRCVAPGHATRRGDRARQLAGSGEASEAGGRVSRAAEVSAAKGGNAR